MKKPIIAVDVDDVLSKTSQGFVEFSNKTWGHTLSPDDYDEDWAKVWGVSVEAARERADFVHENGMIGGFSNFPEAFAVLVKLKERYTLVVATSRRASIETLSKDWLQRHYGGIFSGVYFSGIYDGKLGKHEEIITRTKNELLVDIRAVYLIDDQLKHCIAAGEHGVDAVLFGNYAWNQSVDLPKHVTRCADWEAVEAYFATKR